MTKIFTTYGDKILSLVPQQLFKKNSFGPLVAQDFFKTTAEAQVIKFYHHKW